MVYVVLAHSHEDLLFRGFNLANENPRSGHFFATVLDTQHSVDLVDMWVRVVNCYFSHRNALPDFIYSVIRHLARGSHGIFAELVARMMTYIRNASSDEKNRIVHIIDGVDNIDRKRDAKRYRRFLVQLRMYAAVQHKERAYYDKTVIVLRPETYLDLQHIDTTLPIVDLFQHQIKYYEVKPVIPSRLLKRKCAAVVEPQSKYLQDKKNYAH